MARHDKCLVDASEAALGCVPPAALGCPLSVAHLINHPPAGSTPNVVPAAVDWDAASTPDELVPYLPNVRFATAERTLLAADASARGEETRALPSRLEGQPTAVTPLWL